MRLTSHIQIRCSPEEKLRYVGRARSVDRTLSGWIRAVLNARIREVSGGDGVLSGGVVGGDRFGVSPALVVDGVCDAGEDDVDDGD